MRGKGGAMRNYIVKVLNGMAWGLFASLLIGLIIKQIGSLTGLGVLVSLGEIAQLFMGPAIGAGVAAALGAPPLVVMACVSVGALGAGTVSPGVEGFAIAIGEPAGAFVAALVGAEVGRRIQGRTRVDIVLVPMATILAGGLTGLFVSPYISSFMNFLGFWIERATELQPIPMGIILSVVMGMILTLPISSAAISISLGLTGLAAGASTIGCCCNMIGFAVISYRVNGVGGLIGQGLGTSMLQVPNIIKKPIIWLPVILSSAILGPISTAVFKMQSNASGAGMGTSGLVGQFATLDVMGPSTRTFVLIGLLHFLLPALLSLAIAAFMRARGLIKPDDYKLEI